MWNGITLASVKAVREARFFRPTSQKIAALANKQLTAQPGWYSASGLALWRNSTFHQWISQGIVTFPFFSLTSPHLHVLDTSSQLNASEKSLNRKCQTILKNPFAVRSSSFGHYIPNILCIAGVIKLKYYILRTLIQGKMNLSISNASTC